jgi:hypothetical protein
MKSFILAMIISLGFLTISVAAIRRRKLRDQAAVMWIVVSLVLVLLSLALPFKFLDRVSHGIGIAYASDLLFLLAVIFLVLLVFHLSVSLASVKAAQTALVQEIALLQAPAPPTVPVQCDPLPSEGTSGEGSPHARPGAGTGGDHHV